MNERWMHKEIYLISGKDSVVDFWVVLCIVCRLGFPGILAETYSFLTPLFDYGSCGVELLIMLLASGDSIWDLRVLDFKKKYVPLYVMMAAMLVMTFLVTSDVKGELTTCIRLAVTVLFGLWLADHYDTGRLLELICNAQGLFVLLNLLLFFVLRKWGFYYDEEGPLSLPWSDESQKFVWVKSWPRAGASNGVVPHQALGAGDAEALLVVHAGCPAVFTGQHQGCGCAVHGHGAHCLPVPAR